MSGVAAKLFWAVFVMSRTATATPSRHDEPLASVWAGSREAGCTLLLWVAAVLVHHSCGMAATAMRRLTWGHPAWSSARLPEGLAVHGVWCHHREVSGRLSVVVDRAVL